MSRSRRKTPLAEINVTPFVDVMLVLLVVFMATAPLLTLGIEVNLPQDSSSPLEEQQEPIAVTVDANGRSYIGNTEYNPDELVAALRDIYKERENDPIYLRGDGSARYAQITYIMSLINRAGFTNIALITSPPENEGPDRQ